MKTSQPPRLTARIIPTDSSQGPRRERRERRSGRVTRALSSALIAVLTASILLLGATGDGSPEAHACGQSFPDRGPETHSSGLGSIIPSGADDVAHATSDVNGPAQPGAYGDKASITAYELFGMSGLTFSSYDNNNCAPDFGKSSGNLLSNWVLNLTKGTTGITVGLYDWATAPDLLSGLLTSVDCVVDGCAPACEAAPGNGKAGGKLGLVCSGKQGGLKNLLFLEFLAPIITLGALYMGWVGLVKKRSTEATQAAIWMLCAATFGLIFMSHPTAIANGANHVVNTVNGRVMGAITSASANSPIGASNPSQDMCYLPSNAPQAGQRMATCSLYKALAFDPWAAGQFGTPAGQRLPGQTVQLGNRSIDDIRLATLAAQSIDHDEALEPHRSEVVKRNEAEWEEILVKMPTAGYLNDFSGNNPGGRMMVAVLSLIAAACAGFLIVVISFATVILHLAMLMLILVSPLFLLVGAHPGFGRGIALKWAELLLGTVVKRIVMNLMLAVLIAFYQIILNAPMLYFGKLAMIIAVGVGMIMYRKPMMEAFSMTSLGGTRTGLEQGLDFNQKGKRAEMFGMGALAGGIAGAVGSGSVKGALMGAARGGVMGSRSGSAARAAMMGSGAGRRVAGGLRADREIEERTAKRKAEEAQELQEKQAEAQRQANDPAAFAKSQRLAKKAAEQQARDDADFGGQKAYDDMRRAQDPNYTPKPEREAKKAAEEASRKVALDELSALANPGAPATPAGGSPRPQGSPAPAPAAPAGAAPVSTAPVRLPVPVPVGSRASSGGGSGGASAQLDQIQQTAEQVKADVRKESHAARTHREADQRSTAELRRGQEATSDALGQAMARGHTMAQRRVPSETLNRYRSAQPQAPQPPPQGGVGRARPPGGQDGGK